MKKFALCLGLTLLACGVRPPQPPFQPARALSAAPEAAAAPGITWPPGLPVYDHVVIVVEENKDFEQIIGSPDAPFINDVLRKEGASLTRMFAEEHHSQGNYFWLFSGSNQLVGFNDKIPTVQFTASNLGVRLRGAKPERTFKGYSEDLPKIGSTVSGSGLYARKHVPWISFSNVPNGTTVETSVNLRFADFPAKFSDLPTVAFVIPNLVNDMHNGSLEDSIPAGDLWLRKNMNDYYQWAKQNNSLLIVTFDESDHGFTGLTDPAAPKTVNRNRIATILAGARIKPGDYAEKKGVTHVNLLRTLEAMYGLPQSGSQQPLAEKAGIADGFILTDVFSPEQPGPVH